jgi:DnaJ-domain-containing protein 1
LTRRGRVAAPSPVPLALETAATYRQTHRARPDRETPAAYFQPLERSLRGDPAPGPLLRELERTAPVLIAAADVDRSQIRDLLAMMPEARVRSSWALAAGDEVIRRENDR